MPRNKRSLRVSTTRALGEHWLQGPPARWPEFRPRPLWGRWFPTWPLEASCIGSFKRLAWRRAPCPPSRGCWRRQSSSGQARPRCSRGDACSRCRMYILKRVVYLSHIIKEYDVCLCTKQLRNNRYRLPLQLKRRSKPSYAFFYFNSKRLEGRGGGALSQLVVKWEG